MKRFKKILFITACLLWGITAITKASTLKEISLTPNPFSPYRGGLQINYVIESAYPQAFVSIKVLNVSGETVKVISENAIRNTGVNITDKWDGFDKNNRLAANGRYLVRVEIMDAAGKKQYIFMAALVK